LKKLTLLLVGLIILSISPSIAESKQFEHTIRIPKQVNMITVMQMKDKFKLKELAEEFVVPLTDYEVELISMICQMESGGESKLGIQLVVYVILNRFHDEQIWWGDTIEAIIVNPTQFNGVLNSRWGYYSEETYAYVTEAIQAYYSGEIEWKYYSVQYFHNPSKLNSNSYMRTYGLEVVVDEGGHRFMRKKGE
jgi:hypothetical protein